MGNEDDWIVLDDIKQIKALKPAYHPKVGHPKANRRPSLREKRRRHFVIIVPVEDKTITTNL